MIFDIFCSFVIIYYIYFNFNKINYAYKYSKCYITFGYISNIISLFCTILMIMDSILIMIDLKNEKREVYSYDKKKLIMIKETKSVITKNEFIIIVISLLLNIVFWILILIFWYFILIIIKREYINYLRDKINKKDKSLDSQYIYDNISYPSSDFNQTEDILNQKNLKLRINNNNIEQLKKKSELENRKNNTDKKKESRKEHNDIVYHSLKLNLKNLNFKDNNAYIDKSINSK